MIKIFYILCFLKVLFILAETEIEPEIETTTRKNNSIGPNGTFVDLSDMDTYEMNTREQAAYAERKYLEALRDGELGTWEEDDMEGSGHPHDFRDDEDESEEVSENSKSSKSNVMDVFWRMERKMMDAVPIDGPARNDSRGVEYPPPPAHVRVKQKVKKASIVNTEPAIIEDEFDDAAEEYYDEQFKPGPISRKDPSQMKRTPTRHGNQTFFRGRHRSRKGLTFWQNQPSRMYDIEGVSIKPSPKHWPDPTHRSQNWTGSPSGGYARRTGVQYTRTRQRGGRLRFSRKSRNSSE